MTYAKLNPLTIGLPSSAQLSDGRWVSNFHLLPHETLVAEGWREVEEVKPVYDEMTQYLEQSTAVEENGKLVVTYVAVNLPVEINPEPIIEQLEEIVQ
jgi:hypothetical protein